MEQKYIPRLKETYRNAVVPKMVEILGYANPMAVPKIEKIVINAGVSDAKEDIKALDIVSEEIASITGQKPQLRRAKKSISNFKIRKGMPIGLRITLRGDRMYEFFDRFVSTAVPRIRDFRGFDPNGFDGQGNYNLGLTDQQIFLEIDLEKSTKIRGMNISMVTSAKKDGEARKLLEWMGFPFKKGREQRAESKV